MTQKNEKKENSNDVPEQQNAPKGEKIRLGFKIAKGVAAIIAFSLSIVHIVVRAVQGELAGIANIMQTVLILMFRASNLVLPATSFWNKFVKKLESNKVGKVVSYTVGTIWNTLTSKPAKRFYKIAMAALTLALSPTPVGIALAAVSLASIIHNVTKESLEVRDAKKLMQEHGLLKRSVEYRQKQHALLKTLASKTKLANSQSFIEEYSASSLQTNRKAEELKSVTKTSKVGEVLRAVRDNSLEAFSVIGGSVSGESIDQAVAAFVVLGNVTGEADKNLQKRKEKFAIQQANSELQMEVSQYQSLEELKTLERQERIKTEALARLVQELDSGSLGNQQVKEKFDVICREVEKEKVFAAPPEKSFLEKLTSPIASGVGYIWKSQFGEVSTLYKPKDTEENNISQQKYAKSASQLEQVARTVERAEGVVEILDHVIYGGDKPTINPKTSNATQDKIKPTQTPFTKELASKLQHNKLHNR